MVRVLECGTVIMKVKDGAYEPIGPENSDAIQYFGAILLFPGLIGLCDALWPEKEGAE